jgi:uncharacterized membrane protein YczE
MPPLTETQRLPRPSFAASLKRQVWAWAVIQFGFFIFALAIVLMVRANIGLGPWDVFHVGLHRTLGVSLGIATQLAGLAIIGIAWLAARAKPGLGTVANMIFIGVFIDILMPLVPQVRGFATQLAVFAAGTILVGPATAIYLKAGLGAGPRDGLMLGLSRITGRSVRLVRTGIELAALAAGALMGGKVGLGTVIFAFSIGPVVQASLRLFKVQRAET